MDSKNNSSSFVTWTSGDVSANKQLRESLSVVNLSFNLPTSEQDHCLTKAKLNNFKVGRDIHSI